MSGDKLFDRAEVNWDLAKIQQEIIDLKVKENKSEELDNTEKIILCGLLCSYHPEIIARQLPIGSYDNILKKTWQIYGYLQQIAIEQLHTNINNDCDLSTSISILSVSGFKKNCNSLAIAQKSYSSNQQTKQPYNDKVGTNLKHQKNSHAGTDTETATPIRDRQTKVAFPNQKAGALEQFNNRSIVPVNRESFSLQTDYFPSLNRWNTIGGTITIGFIGIAAILAGTMEYDVVVKTEGAIRPQGEIKLVQATREGKIKAIAVEENQTVKRGDIIAALDDSQLQNERQQLLEEVRQSGREKAQLQERINLLETQIAIEAQKSDRLIDSTIAELQQTQAKYQQDSLTAQSQIEEANAQLNIARQELAKAQTELVSFKANLNATEAGLISAKSKRDRYQKILNSGAISQEQFDEAQLTVQKERENFKSQSASLLGQQKTIEGQRQQLKVAKAKLAQAQAAADFSTDDTPIQIAKQAIEREKATKNLTMTSYLREKKDLVQQKIPIEKHISQKQMQIKQIEENIARSILRATADGKIIELNLRNQNQVVNAQDTITKIAPDTTNLIIKAQVNPKDRQRIKVGQSVKVKINACPYPDYGVLTGKVNNISADTIKSSENEPVSYLVDVVPNALTLVRDRKTCQLQLGMIADASIITKAETPLQFLLRQSRLIRD